VRHFVCTALLCLSVVAGAGASSDEGHAAWIQTMQESPRGPFSRIRWFCNDGTVLPPRAYACREHGGGYQHGEWSSETLKLRERGFLVANLLAGVDPDAFLQQADVEDQYAQLLIERFLMAVDKGWIFRQAMFYRGAIQEENERAGARQLLTALLADPDWIGPRFVALRTGVQLLPHGQDSASIGRVRQWSASLSEDDPAFMPLRIKIHGSPGAEDAARIRDFAKNVTDQALLDRYEALAKEIDSVYSAEPLAGVLQQWSGRSGIPSGLRAGFASSAAAWPAADAVTRLAISGRLLSQSRHYLPDIDVPELRLALMDLGSRLEAEHFSAAAELRASMAGLSRAELISLVGSAVDAAHGTGHLNTRLHGALVDTLATLYVTTLTLDEYRQSLRYLALANGWAVAGMRRYFYPSMEKLSQVEPRAHLFIQDQLRSSPLLFFSQALDVLLRDAGHLAGIRHSVFGDTLGVGFNALNPGFARGVLITETPADHEDLRADGIYLLPETVSDLPPIAGIITRGAGNPLSHVQLLARNLGIPNVSVTPDVAERLRAHDGKVVELAVSPAGQVHIQVSDPVVDEGEAEGQPSVLIRPDRDKLDLSARQPLSLRGLRASDSGRTVGPKAAKLAELRKHYPEAVSRGLAIPFGLFREVVLEQAHRSGSTLWDWMVASYRRLDTLAPDSDQRRAQTDAFREELYTSILNTPLTDGFRAKLREAMVEEFGDTDTGVFVRSDTNVEDLAGFTGAGLNLTLPNVIGFEEVLRAIPRVWASPFTARAFAWRQAHMTAPEHVYTSILLLESVGSDKSGVMVTADIETGAQDRLSVAVNEGLGGAVDGQAAESLRISLDGERTQVLATATAPWRRVPDPGGGILKLPSSGADTVMNPAEIHRLAAFARDLPTRFGQLDDDEGNPSPADVEFGFLDGQLRLFQIRPFLDSQNERGALRLRAMDAALSAERNTMVDLNGLPQG